MTGYVYHNFPAFEAACCELRLRGFRPVYSGTKITDFSKPWKFYMRLALQEMLGCSHIAFLPGSEESRGARLERAIATALEMPLIELQGYYQGEKEDDQENRD
jgi:hypothetical protein